MKLKKILAAVAAAAVAVSTMAISAFAIKDYPDGYTLDLIAEGYDVTAVAGVTFKISGDIDSGVGGGVGFNSKTTGWDQTEWGNDDANKTIKASNGEVTIKRDAPVFQESDVTDPTNPYAQIWMQQWWGTDITIDSVVVLDKDGNELTPAAPAAEEEAAPAEEEAAAPEEEEAAPAEDEAEAEDEDVDEPEDVEEEEPEEESEPEPVAGTEAAPVEEAPAVANATDAPATGNTAVATVAAVMAVAGAAAIVSKKRK